MMRANPTRALRRLTRPPVRGWKPLLRVPLTVGAASRPRALRALARPGNAWLAALALAALAASAQHAPERELLNSERIAQQFGSYGIDVLEQSRTVRVSNLYSGTGDARVTRTFAVVLYPRAVDAALADAHATIVGGGSIGAVLTRHGWEVRKRHRFFGVLDSTRRLQRLMGGIPAQALATHVYVLDAVRPGAEHEYATIVEVHHPDYLTLDDVRAAYGASYTPPTRLDELESLVEALTITRTRMRGAR